MFYVEIDEGNVGKVNASIKILDALYTNESDFDDFFRSVAKFSE